MQDEEEQHLLADLREAELGREGRVAFGQEGGGEGGDRGRSCGVMQMTVDRFMELKNEVKLYKKLHQDYDKRL